ncbi:SDR family oxidoreductase [Bacillus carboniphilus]|uniref:SDR family oxidoreductase n=1 Tax=Bacillus carboniphilus TaxID=86663 RepID=A0ABY9JSL4_9BACI|nr:SDR family oxidoreductase [Bacillus carboniphilus]WLR42394.1 SDR family oxidoreductase [Bacillus carboniphilus]
MKVFVVGANGQIGTQLTNLLKQSDDHSVVAMVRKEEQAKKFEEKGIEAKIADLEGSVEDIAEAAKGCDAIVFSAGSGGQTGYDKTLLIDLDGAAKTIEAAEKAGIHRYVMVSSLQAHNRENWSEQIKPYYVAKHYAEKILLQSNLNYTIVRPGRLLNEPSIGKFSLTATPDNFSIPREDVAKVLFEVIDNKNTFKRSFDVVSGEETITDALTYLED